MSDNQEMSKNELWRQHPAALSRQEIEENARRLAWGESGSGDGHQVASERATLVALEKLQLAGTKCESIRLPDLWIRPSFGERGPGTLEAHGDGFRYSSTSRPDEGVVDVMYGNVKHAFFQPAEKETTITLLHFHLHNQVIVGNKNSKDVQFYVEIEEEERERINMDFQNFVNKVNDDLWGQRQIDLKFEQPLREVGFHGVPYKAPAFIMPTSSCLVELVGDPFLVITLSEVEMMNLERVGIDMAIGQENFDIAIVFKDFERDVLRIDSIPITSLNDILEWLDLEHIKNYETGRNLNWKYLLKAIRDDPDKYMVEESAWEFLNVEGIDSDSEDTRDVCQTAHCMFLVRERGGEKKKEAEGFWSMKNVTEYLSDSDQEDEGIMQSMATSLSILDLDGRF